VEALSNYCNVRRCCGCGQCGGPEQLLPSLPSPALFNNVRRCC